MQEALTLTLTRKTQALVEAAPLVVMKDLAKSVSLVNLIQSLLL